MTETNVRLYAKNVGELIFDGIHAVASSLDAGYPEIKRVCSDSMAVYSENTSSLHIGSSQLVFGGYLLGGRLVPGEDTGSGGFGSTRGSGAGSVRDSADRLRESKALLTSICAPGQEFFLEVGGRRRALYASELTFSSEGPFGTPAAEKFLLRAFSDRPFFHGETLHCGGTARTHSALSLPASGEFSSAVQDGICDIFVKNGGDEFCGFVMDVQFSAATTHFRLSSDREQRSLHVQSDISAGQTIVISTIPGNQYVRTAAGRNLIADTAENSVFHLLPPGDTCLTLRSYSDLPPIVELSFTPGYLIP